MAIAASVAPDVAPKPRRGSRRNAPFIRRRPLARTRAGLPYRIDTSGDTVVVYGPKGEPDELLQFYADRRLAPPDIEVSGSSKRDIEAELKVYRSRALRDIIAVVGVVNAVRVKHPAAHRTMLLDRHASRGIMREFFGKCGCTVKPGSGRNAGHVVQANTEAQGIEISVTVTALSGYLGIMAEAGLYEDHDATKMDPKASRMATGKSKSTSRGEDGRFTVDTDRYFRIRGVGRTAPRTNNPFFLSRVMAAGKAYGWCKAVEVCILAKGRTGGRDFQVRPATWYNYIVQGEEKYIPAPRKGGRRYWRSQKLIVCSELRKGLEELAAAATAGGIRALRALARTNKGKARLKRMFIFSVDGGVSAMSYSYLNDENFRPAIEQAGLRLRNYGAPNVEYRWVTMHQLRHEFTNRLLDHIRDTCANEKDRLLKQVRLAHYMGWRSGEAMLRYYGAWHFEQETYDFISKAQEAANDNTIPPGIEQAVRQAMNDNDRTVVSAVAGGLIRMAA
ncbi:hypothetical protein [Sphingomonas sp.]|jgi:hypothetical protein|uniref:hypothetical protein n=1 Tax=Sphingomonas sp. TaxID=28214 RepID=UPI002E33130C|nr:hypothetical protein [Sphingomonas sp.]HEX4694453.1 hypothetical protein [Sphingomonas sp.]